MTINVTPDVVTSGNAVFQSTSVSIPRPASGVSVDMFLVLGITFFDNQTSDTSVSIAGWTQIPTGETVFNKYCFYRIADSSDTSGGDWTCTCQDGFIEQWAIPGWNGVNTSTPFAVGPNVSYAATTTWTFASTTSPGTGSVWVGVQLEDANSGSNTDPTPPPTNQVQSTDSNYFGPAIIYSAEVDSGSFAPSGTIGNAFEWANVAFFLNPASGGTTENLTEQTGAFTEGTVTRALAYSASGQTATFTEGAVGGNVSYTVGSQTITSSEGSLTGSVSYTASSQTATFSEGSVSAKLAYGAASQTASFTEGAIVPAMAYGLGGNTASFTEGTISASVGGNVTLTLSGQTASFTLGTVTANTTYSVGSQTSTLSSNTIAPAATYGLIGETATFSEGTISASVAGNVTLTLTGITATFSEGTISTNTPVPVLSGTWTFDSIIVTFDSIGYTWDGYTIYTFVGTNSSLLLLGAGS